MFWNDRTKEFMIRARLVARILRASRGVNDVGLTGSLARQEPRPNDFDLVVFHSFEPGVVVQNFTVHINHKDGGSATFNPSGNGDTLSLGLQRAVMEVCEKAKADLMFVNSQALTDCAYLRGLTTTGMDNDFHRRLLCELPLLRYISSEHRFSSVSDASMRHKQGDKCCFPQRTWGDVKAALKAKTHEVSGS